MPCFLSHSYIFLLDSLSLHQQICGLRSVDASINPDKLGFIYLGTTYKHVLPKVDTRWEKEKEW